MLYLSSTHCWHWVTEVIVYSLIILLLLRLFITGSWKFYAGLSFRFFLYIVKVAQLLYHKDFMIGSFVHCRCHTARFFRCREGIQGITAIWRLSYSAANNELLIFQYREACSCDQIGKNSLVCQLDKSMIHEMLVFAKFMDAFLNLARVLVLFLLKPLVLHTTGFEKIWLQSCSF